MAVDLLSWLKQKMTGLRNSLIMLRTKFKLLLCLEELMHGLVLMALMLLLTAMIAPDKQLIVMIIIGFSYILMFVLRLAIRRIWQYFFLLFVYIAVPLLLPLGGAAIGLIIAGHILVVLRAFVLRLTSDEYHEFNLLSDQIPDFVIIFILNFLAVRFQRDDVSQMLFHIMTVHFLVATWRWHAGKLQEQMERFMSKPTQPARQIRRYNQLIFAVYAVIALVLLTLSPMLGLQRIFPWLGRQAIKLLRLILSLIKPGEDEPLPPDEMAGGPMEMAPMPEQPAWLAFLGMLFYYLMNVLFYVGLLAVLIYCIFWIYRRFYKNTQSIDKSESLVPRLFQDIKKQARQTGKRLLRPFGRTDEEKIRDAYTRLVSFLIKQGFVWQSGLSPRKYAAAVQAESGPDIQVLTEIYEKARYAEGLCNTEDVKQMQQLCRQARREFSRR